MNSSRGQTDQKQRFGIKNNDDKIWNDGDKKPHGTRFYCNGANKEIVQKHNGQLQRQGTKEETKLFHQANRTYKPIKIIF